MSVTREQIDQALVEMESWGPWDEIHGDLYEAARLGRILAPSVDGEWDLSPKAWEVMNRWASGLVTGGSKELWGDLVGALRLVE